jgi:hypothetical protein
MQPHRHSSSGRSVLLSALLLTPVPLAAGVCQVPAAHPTIQAAVDDPLCTDIVVAAGSYSESIQVERPLILRGAGASTVLGGFLRAVGAGTAVSLIDLTVQNGCPLRSLSAADGGTLSGLAVTVTASSALPCPEGPLFADGFESGDTSAWSATVP